jgi:beta-phosphoglucomutase
MDADQLQSAAMDQAPRQDFAFIFDMDGTLVDNMGAHHAAWEQFLARYKIKLTRDELRLRMHGKTNREILLDIVDPSLSDVDIERLADEKERLYREEYHAQVKAVAGLDHFLVRVHDARIPCAVATSANAPNIKFVFDLLGLHQTFDAVVGAEQISRGKPDPEVYLLAAQKLGVAPEHCLAFEDSFPGLEAAHRAGMAVIAVTTGHDADEVRRAPGVVDVIDDYEDLDPHALLALIKTHHAVRA